LGGNKIGFMGAESLEIALKENQALEVIVGLDNNMIGDEGAGWCFAAALMVNKTLQRVDLSSNNIGKGGAESLAESLRMNKTLLEIKLIGNNIGNDGTSIQEMKSIFAEGYILRGWFKISSQKVQQDREHHLICTMVCCATLT
jgi:hypothetical protein